MLHRIASADFLQIDPGPFDLHLRLAVFIGEAPVFRDR
jgi:hypothetical protein